MVGPCLSIVAVLSPRAVGPQWASDSGCDWRQGEAGLWESRWVESCGWSFHALDVSSPPSRGSDPAPLPLSLGLEPLLPAGIEAAGVLSNTETLAP